MFEVQKIETNIIKITRKWHILKEDSQKHVPQREELTIRQ
jgi:hypothetical protein